MGIIVGPWSAALAAARSVPSRSTRIRRAIPRDARCIALARPMPDAAPVTSADLPVKSSGIIILRQLGDNRPARSKAPRALGRASRRERECKHVSIVGGYDYLKTKEERCIK